MTMTGMATCVEKKESTVTNSNKTSLRVNAGLLDTDDFGRRIGIKQAIEKLKLNGYDLI